MSHYLCHGGAMCRVILKHASQKLDQLRGVAVDTIRHILGVSLPKEIGSVLANQRVKWIIRFSIRKRRVLSDHNEKDGGSCE